MRFVPAYCIRQGMILGKDLLGKNGDLLLSRGQVLKPAYIKKILRFGYSGVYVTDNLSEDIIIETTISDELRSKAIRAVKNVFISSNLEDTEEKENAAAKAMQIAYEMVDEIIDKDGIMINLVDLKTFDDYTFYHSVNVAVLSIVMGVALGQPKSQLHKLALSALLHDIGKVFIDRDIINKNGKLTDAEYETVKQHTVLGYRYLTECDTIPINSCLGALQHHERYNGSGYPEKRKGDAISLYGRIIAVADVYDALTSNRPYRNAFLPSEAMEYLMGGSGTLFDPEYVKLFIHKVAAYPLGTCVKLSNDTEGIVVENYEDCCTRPKVQVISDGKRLDSFVDLKNDYDSKNVTIVGILKI